MIPDFQSMMLPLLQAISDGNDHTNREVADTLTKMLELTEADRERMLPSGQQTLYVNRLAWVKAHLKKAGLVDSPARGYLRITEQGKQVLSRKPDKINLRFLTQFPSYDWHKYVPVSERKKPEPDEMVPADDTDTPEELLESSYETLREQLASDLLEKTRGCSPAFFERLVVRLLVAMGYGGSLADAGQAIGRTGDGGIDGLIKEDKLGLDVVCVQAKRWEGSVGRPVVQAFAGSMEGFRARKGVLITTGAFSKDALDYVNKIERKIVLIDGKALAEFMIDHGIGVTTARTYTLNKVDSDYFVEDEA
jgi:restriction system protein